MRKAAEERLGQNVPGGEQPLKGPTVEAGVVCPATSKEASVTGGWCQRVQAVTWKQRLVGCRNTGFAFH